MRLAQGAGVQLRVIGAVIVRETRTRFGSSRLGYLWALIEPALWIATFWIAFLLGRRDAPHDMELVPFILTGLVPYSLFRKTADRSSGALGGNRSLLYYPQVYPLDLVLARGALEVATTVGTFMLLAMLHAAYAQAWPRVDDLSLLVSGLVLSSLLGTTLGMVLCFAGLYSPALGRVQGVILRPLFWVSGLFFTANALPSNVRDILLYNPVLHAVELTRDGWFTQYSAHDASALYVSAWILPFACLGLLLERTSRRRLEL